MDAAPQIIVLVGLPGTGKTRLALALADAIGARGMPVVVAHTDVLKVTARVLCCEAPAGPGYAGGAPDKSRWMNRVLTEHASKAHRDAYWLVVEGTLAACFHPQPGRRIELQLDEADRRVRVDQKHPAARRSLLSADLSGYAALLQAERHQNTSIVDATDGVPVLVSRCLDLLGIQ